MALVNESASILSNIEVGPELFLMKLSAPQIASAIQPGQFVHMKIPNMESHILRRPFSVFMRDPQGGTLDILYQVVGFGSRQMTSLSSDDPNNKSVELIGPLGSRWDPGRPSRALLVGGGVGAAPLFMLAELLVYSGVRTDVVLGAQTDAALVCRERYEMLLGYGAGAGCKPPQYATDDGSFGYKGFCTALAQEIIDTSVQQGSPYDYVAVCGPEPVMRIVSTMAQSAHVRCEVSLERRMACGVGACLSCVVETNEGRKRACVDGPIFDARKVVW